MNLTVQTVIKTTLAATLSLAMADTASATWVGGDYVLGAGETIRNTIVGAHKGGWIGSYDTAKNQLLNSPLLNDAWGMQGSWLSFQLTSTATTTVTATADPAQMAPAFTLYRTDISWAPYALGGNPMINATAGPTWAVPGQEQGTLTSGSLHDMSQVAQAGGYGLVWATNNTPGGQGVVETLGYANSGVSAASNKWGQPVNYGANDVSIDDLYESGITGSVAPGMASLTLNNLKAGWYTVFVAGADKSKTGGPIDVTVSSVPVPGAVWLFGSALVGLAGASRKKRSV